MKNKVVILSAALSALVFFSGCSGAFWGGTAAGTGGAATGYELRARQQMDKIEEDLDAGRIDQREFDIRKDQIKQMSLAY